MLTWLNQDALDFICLQVGHMSHMFRLNSGSQVTA